jgi:hypothetical protein
MYMLSCDLEWIDAIPFCPLRLKVAYLESAFEGDHNDIPYGGYWSESVTDLPYEQNIMETLKH